MDKPMSVYAADAPPLLRDFLTYISTIRGKSALTAHEYFLDIRMFLRYLKRLRGLVPADQPFDQISIADIDLPFLREVTLSEAYSFLEFIASERPQQQNSPSTSYGISAKSRARKICSLRALYRYLTEKRALFDVNPMVHLDFPSTRKSLPRYLSVEDSIALLEHVDGDYAERDYCILTFFLNCGMRVSELATLNLQDISLADRSMRVLGKGDKERMLFLNDACAEAYARYLPVRVKPHEKDKNAIFISRNRNRISVPTIKWLVKKYLGAAGLDCTKYSAHKLRHTAATLMYQNGVDIRTLQTVLGHTNLDTTMIYTHIDDVHVREAADRNPLAHVQRKPAKRSKELDETE